jgi:hypothetical protein
VSVNSDRGRVAASRQSVGLIGGRAGGGGGEVGEADRSWKRERKGGKLQQDPSVTRITRGTTNKLSHNYRMSELFNVNKQLQHDVKMDSKNTISHPHSPALQVTMAESADPVPDEMSRQRLVARAAYTTGEDEEQEVAPEKTLCVGAKKNKICQRKKGKLL